jgi:hypothetical protein
MLLEASSSLLGYLIPTKILRCDPHFMAIALPSMGIDGPALSLTLDELAAMDIHTVFSPVYRGDVSGWKANASPSGGNMTRIKRSVKDLGR